MPHRPQPQPALGALRMAGIPIKRVAARGPFNRQYVSRCLHGHVKPSPRLRACVAEMLGKPEHKLFRPDPVDAATERLRRELDATTPPVTT